MSKLDAMLRHSRKQLNQRIHRPMAKHANETYKQDTLIDEKHNNSRELSGEREADQKSTPIQQE